MVGRIKADIILDFVQFWVMLIVYVIMAILPVMAIISGITTEKFNSNASFYFILISIVALLVLYPYLKANIFLITTPLSVF